jgi:hypothetical protein
MSKCISCGVRLTDENRSPHQPTIRCRKCFGIFSNGVEAVLEGRANSSQEFMDQATEAAKKRSE